STTTRTTGTPATSTRPAPPSAACAARCSASRTGRGRWTGSSMRGRRASQQPCSTGLRNNWIDHPGRRFLGPGRPPRPTAGWTPRGHPRPGPWPCCDASLGPPAWWDSRSSADEFRQLLFREVQQVPSRPQAVVGVLGRKLGVLLLEQLLGRGQVSGLEAVLG